MDHRGQLAAPRRARTRRPGAAWRWTRRPRPTTSSATTCWPCAPAWWSGVFWWQAVARGYGLLAPEEGGGLRRRPSYRALATLAGQLAGATFEGPLAAPAPGPALPLPARRRRRAGGRVVGRRAAHDAAGAGGREADLPTPAVAVVGRDGEERRAPSACTVRLTGLAGLLSPRRRVTEAGRARGAEDFPPSRPLPSRTLEPMEPCAATPRRRDRRTRAGAPPAARRRGGLRRLLRPQLRSPLPLRAGAAGRRRRRRPGGGAGDAVPGAAEAGRLPRRGAAAGLAVHLLPSRGRRLAARPPPRRGRADRRGSPRCASVLASLAAAATTPEGVAERRELARLVQRILDALPLRYGDALEWKYVHGLLGARDRRPVRGQRQGRRVAADAGARQRSAPPSSRSKGRRSSSPMPSAEGSRDDRARRRPPRPPVEDPPDRDRRAWRRCCAWPGARPQPPGRPPARRPRRRSRGAWRATVRRRRRWRVVL